MDSAFVALIITSIMAFFALLVAFLGYFSAKKQMFAETISRNRIQWISTVRKLLTEFINLYISSASAQKLRKKYYQISFYLNTVHEDHERLSDNLLRLIDCRECNKQCYSKKIINKTVKIGQRVLSTAWERMKSETGHTIYKEKQARRIMKKYKLLDLNKSPY